MYKIMLKSNSSREFYEWYSEDGEAYSTDDLTELADVYKSLMEAYPASRIVPIQELDTEILVTITD